MRTIIAIAALLIGITSSFGQQQERKLIDRIMKPDASLANPAQNKRFNNSRVASFDRAFKTHAFSSTPKTIARTFPEQRAFTPQQFAARHFRAEDSAANISTRSQLKNTDTVLNAPAVIASTKSARESTTLETTPVREYGGSRPFLDRGKSQKSLSAHNPPLTIEQVRELLNKSK
ncbi:MAG TPA: hypothetical protein VGH00_04405 [Chthoniobacterales bacterium]